MPVINCTEIGTAAYMGGSSVDSTGKKTTIGTGIFGDDVDDEDDADHGLDEKDAKKNRKKKKQKHKSRKRLDFQLTLINDVVKSL